MVAALEEHKRLFILDSCYPLNLWFGNEVDLYAVEFYFCEENEKFLAPAFYVSHKHSTSSKFQALLRVWILWGPAEPTEHGTHRALVALLPDSREGSRLGRREPQHDGKIPKS